MLKLVYVTSDVATSSNMLPIAFNFMEVGKVAATNDSFSGLHS